MEFSLFKMTRGKILSLIVLSSAGAGVAATAQGLGQSASETLPVTTALITDINMGTTPIWDQLPAETDGLYRVKGSQTPSGFDVPRFVSLKFGKVNARTGPSRDHSIAYQYQRRGLPVIVVAETEMWRKVRDIHGDEAWVRKPALSGNRFAVSLNSLMIRTKPDTQARAVARLEQGALVELGDCETHGYCRVETENGVKGWAHSTQLWGAQSDL